MDLRWVCNHRAGEPFIDSTLPLRLTMRERPPDIKAQS